MCEYCEDILDGGSRREWLLSEMYYEDYEGELVSMADGTSIEVGIGSDGRLHMFIGEWELQEGISFCPKCGHDLRDDVMYEG